MGRKRTAEHFLMVKKYSDRFDKCMLLFMYIYNLFISLTLSFFSYQYGPDTYLLQVRDADFPARLREYLSVARIQSSEFQDVKVRLSDVLQIYKLFFPNHS